MALIGAVALIVIGPEKLPRVARTVGTLLGKAQRYLADVKAEVNRSMAMEEINRMRTTVESAAQDVHQSVMDHSNEIASALNPEPAGAASIASEVFPMYQHPKKNWRLKRGVTPQWYKARAGVRTKALSGAARVARFRPRPR